MDLSELDDPDFTTQFDCGWAAPGDVPAELPLLNAPSLNFTDSAFARCSTPLYEVVREKLPYWRALGANADVLSWIEHGVQFPTIRSVPPFIAS